MMIPKEIILEVVRLALYIVGLIAFAAFNAAYLSLAERKIPAWFHCRLVVDHNGRRLAKRHDSLSLRALRQRRLTPMNILAAELPVEV